MAQPYCTGPCAAYVSDARGAPHFLGHSEDGFEVHDEPQYEYVMNDLTGTKVPLDKQDMGEESVVSGVLTRWNEPTYNLIAGHRAGAVPGQTVFGDMGLLMGLEGGAHTLWLVFPYFAKAAMRAGGLPPGRRYPFATLVTKQAKPLGSRALKRFVAWHCIGKLNAATGGSTLYDANMASLPPID